ncbi:MAG: hypothetical protein GF328_04260 [Candidatus Latescibacteria bacterium]|nr:hypothetical protein [Candidatus Latescibacterota bacterium]
MRVDSRTPRRSRGGTLLLWILAVVITLGSAVWQRLSGPTYPVAGTVELSGEGVDVELTRTHGGEGDQPVQILATDPAIEGEVAWRRFPTAEPWRTIPLSRQEEWLVAALPHQPPAGKLEYQVRLRRDGEEAVFPPRPAVTRFKGAVPKGILFPHIFAMFFGMLFANRAGLEALRRAGDPRRFAWIAFILIAAGGFILGPIVQKHAFDAFWTGFPFGYDLTDNKTLIAGIAWVWALWRMRGGRSARISVVVAALVTLVIFMIPHSTWGSEIDWEKIQ